MASVVERLFIFRLFGNSARGRLTTTEGTVFCKNTSKYKLDHLPTCAGRKLVSTANRPERSLARIRKRTCSPYQKCRLSGFQIPKPNKLYSYI